MLGEKSSPKKTMKFPDLIGHIFSNLQIAVVSNVPGSNSSVVFEAYNRINKKDFKISFHEEVAFTIAHAAALVGKRSACLIKTHGLVKAGNSAIDALSCGTTAGFVTFAFSDKKGSHSDNIFDVIPFLKGLSIPYFILERNNLFQQIEQAYYYSDKFEIPVVMVVDDTFITEDFNYIPQSEYTVDQKVYSRNLSQHLVCPVFGEYQYDVLQRKLQEKSWLDIPPPLIPKVDSKFPTGWKETIEQYRPVFDVFKELRGSLVFGDTGISSLFAFEPYNCVDVTTYMGGSVPLAIGALLAGQEDVWAITGDFSFIAAGYLGLIEALNQNVAVKIIIFNNKKAQTTGGQNIAPTLLNKILEGFCDHVHFLRVEDDLVVTLNYVKKSSKLEIVVIEFG